MGDGNPFFRVQTLKQAEMFSDIEHRDEALAAVARFIKEKVQPWVERHGGRDLKRISDPTRSDLAGFEAADHLLRGVFREFDFDDDEKVEETIERIDFQGDPEEDWPRFQKQWEAYAGATAVEDIVGYLGLKTENISEDRMRREAERLFDFLDATITKRLRREIASAIWDLDPDLAADHTDIDDEVVADEFRSLTR